MKNFNWVVWILAIFAAFFIGWVIGSQALVAKEAGATYKTRWDYKFGWTDCRPNEEGKECGEVGGTKYKVFYKECVASHLIDQDCKLGEVQVINILDKEECTIELPACVQPTPEAPKPPSEALAPQCPNNRPVLGLANPHVIRNGSEATVNAFVLEGDRVNILFRTSGQKEWEHALRDVPVTNGYMSVTIHDLVVNGDYDFGIQNSNGCAGGEIVAVIVDSWQPQTFSFTRWERL